MINKIFEIFVGWKNYIFRKDIIERMAKERLAICKSCDYYSRFNVCTRCTCPSAGKSRSPDSICVEGKWPVTNTNTASIIDVPHVPMVSFKSSDDYIDHLNTTT